MIHLATLLNLSEALAGCTIVACSNSAADILSGIIAAYSDPKQLGIFSKDSTSIYTYISKRSLSFF